MSNFRNLLKQNIDNNYSHDFITMQFLFLNCYKNINCLCCQNASVLYEFPVIFGLSIVIAFYRDSIFLFAL